MSESPERPDTPAGRGTSVLDGATGWEPLSGGAAHDVQRVRLADGRPAVVKRTPTPHTARPACSPWKPQGYAP